MYYYECIITEPTTTPPLTPNQEDDSLSLMEIDFPNQQDEMINTETKANCKAKVVRN